MAVPQASNAALQMISKMITWDPSVRISLSKALDEEFITKFKAQTVN